MGLLGEMAEDMVRQDATTRSAAISTWNKDGKWQLAMGLLAKMAEGTAQQNALTSSAAAGAGERAGEWQRALGLLVDVALASVPLRGVQG